MARNKKNADGRYRYRVYLGKNEDGSKKFKSFYGSTEREAKAAAAAYRTAIGQGLDPEQSKATLGDLYANLPVYRGRAPNRCGASRWSGHRCRRTARPSAADGAG